MKSLLPLPRDGEIETHLKVNVIWSSKSLRRRWDGYNLGRGAVPQRHHCSDEEVAALAAGMWTVVEEFALLLVPGRKVDFRRTPGGSLC